jgi:hypothetical protein
MAIKSLPWSTDEYAKLEPGDLLPDPAPTPEQRIRVAAAIATMTRDGLMLGKSSAFLPNSETIRSVLTMSAEEWALQIPQLRPFLRNYDVENPKVRFEQISKITRGARN